MANDDDNDNKNPPRHPPRPPPHPSQPSTSSTPQPQPPPPQQQPQPQPLQQRPPTPLQLTLQYFRSQSSSPPPPTTAATAGPSTSSPTTHRRKRRQVGEGSSSGGGGGGGGSGSGRSPSPPFMIGPLRIGPPDPTPTPRRRPRRPDPSAPKITPPCSECGKRFWSWKALFGHMRCHPERTWRGINPPSDLRRPPPTTFQLSTPSASDREVANSLLLLGIGSGGASTSTRFECSSCKKTFPTHQALGGHRASHKNVKGCYAMTRDGEYVDDPLGLSLGPTPGPAHTCAVCSKGFVSAQTLAAHVRTYHHHQQQQRRQQQQQQGGEASTSAALGRAGPSTGPGPSSQPVATREGQPGGGFDLNVPAQEEEDAGPPTPSSSSSSSKLDLRLGYDRH